MSLAGSAADITVPQYSEPNSEESTDISYLLLWVVLQHATESHNIPIRRQVAQKSWSIATTAANVACTVMAAFSTSHVSGMSPSA